MSTILLLCMPLFSTAGDLGTGTAGSSVAAKHKFTPLSYNTSSVYCISVCHCSSCCYCVLLLLLLLLLLPLLLLLVTTAAATTATAVT
jgi:hypothetical protein